MLPLRGTTSQAANCTEKYKNKYAESQNREKLYIIKIKKQQEAEAEQLLRKAQNRAIS